MAKKTGEEQKPILIIGAGLAGLAIARLLTNIGIANIVFEAAAPERSQGYSISLREWGYEALLQALGDLPLRQLTKAVAPDRWWGGSGWLDQIMRDNATGDVLVEPDEGQLQPIVRANRNALRKWIEHCGDEDVDVRYLHKLKTCSGEMGSVMVGFDNGAHYVGSLVIAADGVHSAVRSQLLPHITPEILPAMVYHGDFKVSHQDFDRLIRPLTGDGNILAGVGDSFNTPITICNVTKSHVHLDWSYSRPAHGDDDLLYKPDSTTETAYPPQPLLDELASLKLAEPWASILSPQTVVAHSVFQWTSRCVFVPLADIQKAQKRGVVFVGDSWHAMPIFGGEGGNHAILDGVELASAIQRTTDLQTAVESYYNDRFKPCREAVMRSRQRFHVLHRPMSQWREIAEKKRAAAAG